MWETFISELELLIQNNSTQGLDVIAFAFPVIILMEMPFYVLVMIGMLRFGFKRWKNRSPESYYPSVSCLVTCYSEGEDIRKTISSLVNQRYAGKIQIIPIIDGAIKNHLTLKVAYSEAHRWKDADFREIMVLPKWQRGGRVSSLNAALPFATGEILMALDGDTSFDNDMVEKATKHFKDPLVAGVAGNLRVRNHHESLAAKIQGLEYVLSISAGKTGLSEFNIVNNISGAFGIFRASIVRLLGGWDAGSAEDLDMTLRIKQYFGRHAGMKINFEPHAIGHTDAPNTWYGFAKQRVRWDGDMFYIFIRKFRFNLRPSLLGWRNFLFTLINGLVMQLVLPFLIMIALAAALFTKPIVSVLASLALLYVFYFFVLSIFYVVYLVTVSERVWFDIKYLPYLPLFPFFATLLRIYSVYCILMEIFTKSHLDSSMAPPWVLKKNKF